MTLHSIVKWVAAWFALLFVYVLWPIYGFMAEDNPSLRNPWAWREVPDATHCESAQRHAAMQSMADQACAVLLGHQARLHAPSLSAAIAIDGELVWSAAVGWADLANGIPATPQTLYRIGSTSNPSREPCWRAWWIRVWWHWMRRLVGTTATCPTPSGRP